MKQILFMYLLKFSHFILSYKMSMGYVCATKCSNILVISDPHLWQGDIELDPDEEKRSDSGHQFVSIKGHKWPNGRIPYVIESSLGK